MKCPHCNYQDGWSPEEQKVIEGDHGDFYEISNDLVMERTDRGSYWGSKETKSLVGCPNCNKVFMD